MAMTEKETQEWTEWRKNHREELSKPMSANAMETRLRASREDAWLFPLAMNELAREENGEPAPKKS
jgi:hypothetical protein